LASKENFWSTVLDSKTESNISDRGYSKSGIILTVHSLPYGRKQVAGLAVSKLEGNVCFKIVSYWEIQRGNYRRKVATVHYRVTTERYLCVSAPNETPSVYYSYCAPQKRSNSDYLSHFHLVSRLFNPA